MSAYIPGEVNRYAPDDPGAAEWDVAVVGTGMGGAAAGFELARLGRRVLFIEKGMFPRPGERDRPYALSRCAGE